MRKESEKTTKLHKEIEILQSIGIEGEKSFMKIIEIFPFPVIILSEDMDIQYINEEFIKVFGYTLQDIPAGKEWFELAYPDRMYREKVISEWEESLKEVNIGKSIIRNFDVMCKDGRVRNILFRLVKLGNNKYFIICEDITARKKLQETLKQKLMFLTQPVVNTDNITFYDLFHIEEIQKIQDTFSEATGVASIITEIDGTPITRPSNFCRLCNDIIRQTPKGRANCYHSDAVIGKYNLSGPVVQPCLSGSLWDAGASIRVGDRHVANWLIGQIIDEDVNLETMMNYAREIGADEKEYYSALKEVKRMPVAQFKKVSEALFLIANQLSLLAMQNIKQARDIAERKKTEEQLRMNENRLETLLNLGRMQDRPLNEILDFTLEKTVELTGSKLGYLAFLNEDETALTMHSWSKNAMKECSMCKFPLVYNVAETGLWGEAIRQRKPVITNDYAGDNPAKKGYPPGHVELKRHMNVPVFSGDKIVALAGVGNKEDEYDYLDVQHITLLMEGMWGLLQRKNAGDIIKKQIFELEAKNAELERFTYTVSHDLKSPLITIKGFLGHIISDGRKGNFDRMESDIKRISNAVDKMEYLLKDLLELSRIGRIINPSSKFSMSSSVKEAAELVNGFLEEKHVKFSYDENMPVVYADRIRIREVWQNLIENAVKYTGNQDKPEINIGYKNTDREDVFYIKDNGTGIEEKYYNKIFGLFEKLEHKSEGTGIGLAIVKRIIELHGGHIWVESEGKEKGSTFYFNIPLKEGIE